MKINANRNAPLAVAKAKGSAAYHWIATAASTACTGPGEPPRPRLARASIAIVAPERARNRADKWADVAVLTIRPNDPLADGKIGGYFTSGCLDYADSNAVAVAADNRRPSEIAFNRTTQFCKSSATAAC